jgi:hypothetical protein
MNKTAEMQNAKNVEVSQTFTVVASDRSRVLQTGVANGQFLEKSRNYCRMTANPKDGTRAVCHLPS